MLNEIYIVRHAAPQQGTNIPYDRVPGPPLAELGRGEARAAALYLSHCGIEKLYASPLDRAMETAAIIAEETGLERETVEDIREMRNYLIHVYDKVNYRRVWDAVQNKLPQLQHAVQRVLDEHTAGNPD